MAKTATFRWIVLALLLVGVALALAVILGAQDEIQRMLEWTERQGPAAPLLLVALIALIVLLLVPGVVFTTGAGFVFGIVGGTACIVLGTTLGAAIAFLAARYLFGERAKSYVLSRGKLRLIGDELGRNGWKIVMLTRLIPFFPGKLSNYVFGVTPVSLPAFVGGTFVGVIPFSLHNAYLGSLAAEIATDGSGRGPDSTLDWVVYGGGFMATAVAVIYFGRLAMRALTRYQRDSGNGRERCRG